MALYKGSKLISNATAAPTTYVAGNGLLLNGQVFNAKVDGETIVLDGVEGEKIMKVGGAPFYEGNNIRFVNETREGIEGTFIDAQVPSLTGYAKLTDVTANGELVKNMVPTNASSENKLADQAYVNDVAERWSAWYISTVDGVPFEYTGTGTETKAELIAAAEAVLKAGPFKRGEYISSSSSKGYPSKNDYATLRVWDKPESEGGIRTSYRYVYQGFQTETYNPTKWRQDYIINIQFSTAEQAAMDSGITSTKVAQYDKNLHELYKDDTATTPYVTNAAWAGDTSGNTEGAKADKIITTDIYPTTGDGGVIKIHTYNGQFVNNFDKPFVFAEKEDEGQGKLRVLSLCALRDQAAYDALASKDSNCLYIIPVAETTSED